jgi:hypothetical protein
MEAESIETSNGVSTSFTEEAVKKMRGRRPKATKPPTRLERANRLRERLLGLTGELEDQGFGKLLSPPGNIRFQEEPDPDPKTKGMVGKVKEPLAAYIQRVSVIDNFSQRPPFDHVTDPIYKRLIRDFIAGGLVPEMKVAAVDRVTNGKIEDLTGDSMRCSIIDGLQRLYCKCIAILLVLYRNRLVTEGLITSEAWEYFEDTVSRTGEPKAATEELLHRLVRYELFYRIDLGGLLHYMVTFNTGQRRMSLPVQLEIMRQPLIQELEQRAKINLWRENEKMPGMTKPKDKFKAADLVLAVEAFITNNAQVAPASEADKYLEDQTFLDEVGDIDEVVTAIRRIATELHPLVMSTYADDPGKRYVISDSSTFLFGLMAACGYVRNSKNMKVLDGELDRLIKLAKHPTDDPLNFEDYDRALASITASRGKATRRLVDDTFRRFFNGATDKLDWLDTARSISGARVEAETRRTKTTGRINLAADD